MLSLMGFLALHVSLVFSNTTTIEAFEKTKAGSKWKYDMGRQRNVEQVRLAEAPMHLEAVRGSACLLQ